MHPANIPSVLANMRRRAPGTPFVERGCAPESSAVSVVPITARVAVHGYADTLELALEPIGNAAGIRRTTNYLGSEIIVFLSPHSADQFREAKWSKQDIQRYLYEHARILPTSYYGRKCYRGTVRRNVEAYFGKETAGWVFDQEGTATPLPIVTDPAKFIIVVVGGHGTGQNAVLPGGHGNMATREIRLPRNWEALVAKYKAREIERFRDAGALGNDARKR